jgi:hypothetical protein
MTPNRNETAADRHHLAVRNILMSEWDPVGVKGESRARDEYDSYIDGICRSLLDKRSAEDIAAHLLDIETRRMGLPGDNTRARRVAAILVSLAI